ncbi:hypothetical protein L1987_38148 [Smallanthus sonchifolius]|uniref:Uncharacterized protein n=1 Tax=Smallanthus sonchifolius TaxID=185202 RepID=A0ACB9HJ95_9ASTR|nr:hypothetical protein L1987_38148 [Smallanthus sonchifolius]
MQRLVIFPYDEYVCTWSSSSHEIRVESHRHRYLSLLLTQTHIYTFVNSVTVRAGPCQLSPNSVTVTGVLCVV